MPHQAQDALRRKLIHGITRAQQHLPAPLPGLFVLTDPDRLRDPLAMATNLFSGTGLIYRHFGDPKRLQTARALAKTARRRNVILLIGNDPELAQTIGADGVHWPETSLDSASQWTGKFKFMTCAAHSLDAMIRARQAGIDAVLVSTVFASSSPSASTPIGPDRLKHWVNTAKIPTYGLGGVTADNFSEISGFAGGAMIGGAAILTTEPRT